MQNIIEADPVPGCPEWEQCCPLPTISEHTDFTPLLDPLAEVPFNQEDLATVYKTTRKDKESRQSIFSRRPVHPA